jgi:hypothetical protein
MVRSGCSTRSSPSAQQRPDQPEDGRIGGGAQVAAADVSDDVVEQPPDARVDLDAVLGEPGSGADRGEYIDSGAELHRCGEERVVGHLGPPDRRRSDWCRVAGRDRST